MKHGLLFLSVVAALLSTQLSQARYIQEGNQQTVMAPGVSVAEISMPGRSVMSLDGNTVVYLKRDIHNGLPNDRMNLVAQDLRTGQYLEIIAWGITPYDPVLNEDTGEYPPAPWGEIQRVSVDRSGTWITFEVRRPLSEDLWVYTGATLAERCKVRGNSLRQGAGAENYTQIYVAKIRNDQGILAPHRTAIEKISLISLSMADRTDTNCMQPPPSNNSSMACRGGNGDSYASRISGDGKFVAFATTANDLIPFNDVQPVFTVQGRLVRWNRETDQVQELALTPDPIESITVSEDGKTIAYGTAKGENSHSAIYVWKEGMAVPQLISQVAGQPGVVANGNSGTPFVSADGKTIAFDSDASNLLANAPIQPGIRNIYSYNLVTGQMSLVSASRLVTAQGVLTLGAADASSEAASVSADGRYVAFRSKAKYLVPCYPGAIDSSDDEDDNLTHARVYLWESATGRITVLSAEHDTASISSDGLFTTVGDLLPGGNLQRLEGVGKLWDGQDRSFGMGNGATITCNAQAVPTVSWCGDQPQATFTWGQYNALTAVVGNTWTANTATAPRSTPFLVEGGKVAILTGRNQGSVVWKNQTEADAQRYVPFQINGALNILTGQVSGQIGQLVIPDTYQVTLSVDESCHASALRGFALTVPAAAGAAGKPSLSMSIDASASGIDMNSLTTQFPLAWNGDDADAVLVLRKLPNNQLKVLGLYDGMQMGKSTQGQDVRYVNVPVTDLLGTTTQPRGGVAARLSLDDIRIALVRYQAGTSPLSD